MVDKGDPVIRSVGYSETSEGDDRRGSQEPTEFNSGRNREEISTQEGDTKLSNDVKVQRKIIERMVREGYSGFRPVQANGAFGQYGWRGTYQFSEQYSGYDSEELSNQEG